MNEQYWYGGFPFEALSNRVPINTDQIFYGGLPFNCLFPLNKTSNNFWLTFE